MSHLFSPPATGLRRIILDFSHLMKCSAEKIHKYRVGAFCFFPFFQLWLRQITGRQRCPSAENRSKNKTPYSESDKYL